MAYISKINNFINNTDYDISAIAVKVTDTTPTSSTTYYPNFTTGKTAGDNFLLRANTALTFIDNGTSSGEILISNRQTAYVSSKSSTTSIKVSLDSANSGNHGVYSWGYWDGETAHTASGDQKWLVYRNTSGDVILNGNAATATKLATARTLTIGSTGKIFDGSANVSWSHADIGATVSNTWTAGTTAGPTIKTTVNGVAGTAVAIPSASKTASGVITTGTQDFQGRKGFGYMNRYGYNDSGTALQWIADTYCYNAAGTQVAEYWYDCGHATNITKGQWYFTEYSPQSTADTTTTGKREGYYLPNVTSGLTSDVNYAILTSKNAVTIAQGGTGQTTAQNAINALLGGLPTWSATPTDTTYFIRQDTAGAAEYGKVPFSTLYTYIKGKTDTLYAPISHNHYQLVTEGDNRSVATTPNSYNNNLVFRGLKTNSAFGSPSSDTYSYVVGLRGWSDASCGNAYELAFTNSGIFCRNGATTSWGSWDKILTSSVGDSTYVKKSGDTMTGTLTVPKINLSRASGTSSGRISWWNGTYKTWTTYMSNAASGTCPSGGTPSTLGNVTTYAIRSYIENGSGYGWLWESAAENNTGTPTARMALSAYDGTLQVAGLIKSTLNSNTVTIGSQNTGFCHFMNSANIPYYFDHEVQANGGFWVDNGNGSLGRAGKGVSWYLGRSNALVRVTTSPTSNGWNPITSCKTTSGDWSTGILGETYYFVYTTDTNFNAGTNSVSNGVRITNTSQLYGAVWNDYAEFRITKNKIEPGRCIIETGNDDLVLSTKRLQPGAEIVSDTFGFAIGETDEAKTPIASNGRVLAYIYEGREAARANIGKPVCSGPDGTVSIMTDEEYQKYGYCAIGTISAVPDYEEWGTEKVKVNNRIWIRIR